MAPLISAREIYKSFGGLHLLRNATFEVHDGDRIGLVGRNGTGKSTLFKMLLGTERVDMGDLEVRPGLRIGVLSQYQTPDSPRTLHQDLGTHDYLDELNEELEGLNGRLADPAIYEDGSYDEIMTRYNALQEETARFDAEGFRSRAVEALKALSFGHLDLDKRIRDLSGGERRKVALSKVMALSGSLDLLLLDEPTNHLDIAAIECMENFLNDFLGTVVVTSHDRYLLDDTVSRIFEITGSRLFVYEGDFTDFVEQKEALLALQAKARERFAQHRKRSTQMIAKLKARNRFDAQIRSKLRRMKRIRAPSDPIIERKAVRFKFDESEFGGRIVSSAKGLMKSYGEQVLMDGVEFEVEAGDRVGLIGPNGSGKTTLLRILRGDGSLDGGDLFMSKVIRTGYFDQGHLSLDPEKSLVEELQTVIDNLHENDAKSLLGRFQFKGNMVYNTVETLSGGERARLAILKLVVSPFNFLLLDEPTNHLDIPARQSVETALASYKGTMLIASHDRYLLDAVCDRIFDLREGKLQSYRGNYTQYRSLDLTHPSEREEEADSHRYVVRKKFTLWATGKRHAVGDVITIRNEDLETYKWELESGRLEREEG